MTDDATRPPHPIRLVPRHAKSTASPTAYLDKAVRAERERVAQLVGGPWPAVEHPGERRNQTVGECRK